LEYLLLIIFHLSRILPITMYSSFSKRRCYSAVPSNGAATEKGGQFVTRGNQFEHYRGFPHITSASNGPHITTASNGVVREDHLCRSDSDRRGEKNLRMDHTSEHFRGFRDTAPSNGVARDDGLFLSSSGRSGGEVRIDLSDGRFRQDYSTPISNGVARDVNSFGSDSNCGDKGRMDHNNDHFRGFPSVVSDGGEVRTGLSDDRFRREFSTPINNSVSRAVSSFMSPTAIVVIRAGWTTTTTTFVDSLL
jgi:hypothetical protein